MIEKPMLAGQAPEDPSTLRYPVLVSPKLDGIRCLVIGGRAVSRKLKPIPNTFVREWIEAYVPEGVDGELLLRDLTAPFRAVSSAIMSADGEPDFVFCAFDWKQYEDLEFRDRLYALHLWETPARERASNQGVRWRVDVVPHREVMNAKELMIAHTNFIAMGYEGTMIRDPEGPYKFGRSTTKQGWLLKLKNFVDEEAVVVGVEEMMHNANELQRDELGHAKRSTHQENKQPLGTLGALVCRFPGEETEWRVGGGPGLTQELRQAMWDVRDDLIGQEVKIKHQPDPGGRKHNQAPRIPQFLGFRQD